MKKRFITQRLFVEEVIASQKQRSQLLADIVRMLTPSVVENLPAYFHNITNTLEAEIWLQEILTQSRLFVVKEQEEKLSVGFLFISTDNERNAHIGYLLAEDFWGVGFAVEMLKGFVEWCDTQDSWDKLIAGVDNSNKASLNLLKKLGFTTENQYKEETFFYEYALC